MASCSYESNDSPEVGVKGRRKRTRSQDESVMPLNAIASKRVKSSSQGKRQKLHTHSSRSSSHGGRSGCGESECGGTQCHACPQQKSQSPNEGHRHLSRSFSRKCREPSSSCDFEVSRKRHCSHDLNSASDSVPSERKRMKHEQGNRNKGHSSRKAQHRKPRTHSPSRRRSPNWAGSHQLQERVKIFDKSWKSSMVPLSENGIVHMAELPVEELVNKLSNNIKAFQYTLANKRLLDKPGIMDALIKILSKVAHPLALLNNDLRKGGLLILTEAMSDSCAVFQFQLKLYINLWYAPKPGTSSRPQEEKLKCLYKLFYDISRALPAYSKSWLPVEDFKSAIEQLANPTSKKDLLMDIEVLLLHLDVEREEQLRKNHEGDISYMEIEIIPNWNEVCTPQKPQLRENIVSGGYCSSLHYYDTQFRLLREDFVAPLRKGICEYLEGGSGRKSGNIRVYKKVHLKEPVIYAPHGVCYGIKVHLSSKIDWAHSKRFLHGALLCLTPEHDNFKEEIFFATIVNREGLNKGELIIQFKKDENMLPFSCKGTSFIMVEPCALFEPTQHILRALQTAQVDTMPFTEYLIKANASFVGQPRYFAMSPKVEYNLSSLLTEEAKNTIQDNSASTTGDAKPKKKIQRNQCFLVKEVADFKQWPSCDQTGLDASQLKGIHMALTQEIAVIQGPPGTGKTHIGLKIVEALLSNSKIHNQYGARAPILVMCYTNHALDQFLEGILKSPEYKHVAPRLIRVGGRSKSEELAKFNLYEVRKNVFIPPEVRREKYSIEHAVKKFESPATKIFLSATNRSMTFPLEVLAREELIQYKHYYQLFELQRTPQQSHCVLEMWLGLEKSNCHWNKIVDSAISKFEQETSPQASSYNGKESSDAGGESEVLTQEEEAGETIEQSHDEEDQSDYANRKEFTSHSGSKFSVYEHRVNFDKNRAHKILKYGFSLAPMSEENSMRIQNIHTLTFEDRWRLYLFWHSQHLKHLREECEKEFMEYENLCSEQADVRRMANCFTLETASIIGMTTTGVAKHHNILRQVKPKIVIVEEAAEVFESHIVSALNADTQHLILIGDHKQLRPKPNEYELAKKYKLDVSLFERLVLNDFPCATLECQHRMRPEIAELVKPHIYSKLSNHSSVKDYPGVRGVSTNLFFIKHDFPEEEDQNLLSHSNDHEAKYLISLCQYLLQQDQYSPENITILVTYTGQQRRVRRLISESKIEGACAVRVDTVDNFQGEENNIILLSLVRSNSERSVGFLKEENRVCVALSRAQHGFYCIGNFDMLRGAVPLWERIMADMEVKEQLGEGLLLCCSNHPENNFVAKSSEDFEKNSPEGGCLLDCNFRLECGHACTLKCHFTDLEHVHYKCKKKCINKCPEGHGCPLDCHQKIQDKCPPCEVKVPFIMPSCLHKQFVECHKDTAKILCSAQCSRKCAQGHQCRKLCHEECGECMEPVSKVLEVCRHEIDLPCHVEPIHSKCTKPCEKVLLCGHKCQLKCGENCSTCLCAEVVTAKFPDCGHKIQVPCHVSRNLSGKSDVVCKESVTKLWPCGHTLKRPCFQTTAPEEHPCKVLVTKLWPCGHTLKRQCYQTATPEEYPCLETCNKELACGHSCTKPCGQACDDECQNICNQVLSCGHKCQGQCSQCTTEHMHKLCPFKCEVKRFCGHSLETPCSGLTDDHSGNQEIPITCWHGSTQVRCTAAAFYRCLEPCLWRCRHFKCSKRCYEVCDRPKCDEHCRKKLRCGHTCLGLCGEPCLTLCPLCQPKQFEKKLSVGLFSESEVYYELDCKHIFPVECLDKYVHQLTDSESHMLVCPVQCPECSLPLSRRYRYGNDVKRLLPYIKDIRSLVSVNHKKSIEDEELLSARLDSLLSNEATSSVISRCKGMMYSGSLSFDEKYTIFILTEVIDILKILCEQSPPAGIAACYKKAVEETEKFMKKLSNMVPRVKLTHQVVGDLQREFFRLYLQVYTLLVKSGRKPPVSGVNSHQRMGSPGIVPLTPPSLIVRIDSGSFNFPAQTLNSESTCDTEPPESLDGEDEISPRPDIAPLVDAHSSVELGFPTQASTLESTSDIELESLDGGDEISDTVPLVDTLLSVQPSIFGSPIQASTLESPSDAESGELSDSEDEKSCTDSLFSADLPESTLIASGGLPSLDSEDQLDNSASLSVYEDQSLRDEDSPSTLNNECPMLVEPPDPKLQTRSSCNVLNLVEVKLAIVAAEEYLKDVPVKVTKNDIMSHCGAMSKPLNMAILDYKKMLERMDRFYPVVQKGQWWRCPIEKEYYCLPPSSDGNEEMKCPKCNDLYKRAQVFCEEQQAIQGGSTEMPASSFGKQPGKIRSEYPNRHGCGHSNERVLEQGQPQEMNVRHQSSHMEPHHGHGSRMEQHQCMHQHDQPRAHSNRKQHQYDQPHRCRAEHCQDVHQSHRRHTEQHQHVYQHDHSHRRHAEQYQHQPHRRHRDQQMDQLDEWQPVQPHGQPSRSWMEHRLGPAPNEQQHAQQGTRRQSGYHNAQASRGQPCENYFTNRQSVFDRLYR